jgi:hypothetical protein
VRRKAWTSSNNFHIELFAHDVIYAEGATAETFWPFWNGSYDHFDNFAEHHRLYPRQEETAPQCAAVLWGPPGPIERTLRRALRPLRSAVAPWIDTRTSVEKIRDKIRDQLAERAKGLLDA